MPDPRAVGTWGSPWSIGTKPRATRLDGRKRRLNNVFLRQVEPPHNDEVPGRIESHPPPKTSTRTHIGLRLRIHENICLWRTRPGHERHDELGLVFQDEHVHVTTGTGIAVVVGSGEWDDVPARTTGRSASGRSRIRRAGSRPTCTTEIPASPQRPTRMASSRRTHGSRAAGAAGMRYGHDNNGNRK